MSDLELLLEGEKRGLLPPDKQSLLDEGRKRGLVPALQTNVPGMMVGVLPQDPRPKDRFSDWTDEQKKSYAAYKAVNKSSYAKRMTDSAGLGWTDELNAAGEAVGQTAYDLAHGEFKPGERYSQNLQVQRAVRDDNRKATDGSLGTAADIAGGLGSIGPGAGFAAAGQYVPVLSRITSAPGVIRDAAVTAKNLVLGRNPQALKEIANDVYQGGKAGAGYGAVQAAGEEDGDIFDRLKAMPGGAAWGAAIGGGFGGAVGFRQAVQGTGYNRAAGIAARNEAIVKEARDAGVELPGFAVTSSPTAQATAQGLGNSLTGGPIRERARQAIGDLERRTNEVLGEHTEGRAPSDIGEEMQRQLKQNLTKRSRSSAEIDAMTPAEREAMTGKVSENGFSPAREVVSPVAPREVAPVDPAQFRQEVPPRQIEQIAPEPRYKSLEEIPHDQELMAQYAKVEAQRQKLAAYHDSTLAKEYDIAAQGAAEAKRRIAGHTYGPSNEILSTPELHSANRNKERHTKNMDRYAAEMQSIREQYDTVADHASNLKSQIEQKRLADHEREYNAETERAAGEARQRTVRAQQTEVQRARASAETNASSAAQAETIRRRAEARSEAETITQAKQKAADEAFKRRVDAGETYRTGRSRETYPTEFDAAYTTFDKEAPKVPVPLLGRKAGYGTDGKSGVRLESKTATSQLLLDVVNDEATRLHIPRQERLFVEGPRKGPGAVTGHGDLTPEAKAVLNDRFGSEVYSALEEIGRRRGGDVAPPNVDSIRKLRTMVREEMDAHARARRIGETRGTDEAALTRLHGAITDDLHRTLREAGPKGARASSMLRDIDQAYASHMEQMRKPLAKLYGDKVTPIQAMERLGKAVEAGDLPTLRSYMRVMSEKGDANFGATTLISHMAGEAKNMRGFLQSYRSLAPQVKSLMFAGEKGAALRQQLDRLSSIERRLAPYEKMAAQPGGIDLSRISHSGPLYLAYYHPVTALFAHLGSAGVARFMASPRYVNWLTQIPAAYARGPKSPGVVALMSRLAVLATNDPKYGNKVLKSVAEAFSIGKANAATGGDGKHTPKAYDAPQKQPPQAVAIGQLVELAKRNDVDVSHGLPVRMIREIIEKAPTDQNLEMVDELASLIGITPPSSLRGRARPVIPLPSNALARDNILQRDEDAYATQERDTVMRNRGLMRNRYPNALAQ